MFCFVVLVTKKGYHQFMRWELECGVPERWSVEMTLGSLSLVDGNRGSADLMFSRATAEESRESIIEWPEQSEVHEIPRESSRMGPS